MKKRIIFALTVIAMLTLLFAIPVSADEVVKMWDVSATSSDNVSAYLYNDTENDGYYTLTIRGNGAMTDWNADTRAPWYSSYRGKIVNIRIEDGVTAIGNYAFEDCTFVKNIEISNSVLTVGTHTFYNCTSLPSIKIPSSVTTIGKYALSSCLSLTNIEVDENNQYYCSVDGNLYSKDMKTLFHYAIGKEEVYFAIPVGVATIGKDAFYKCSFLKNVDIPATVEFIDEFAFQECTSLVGVAIPKNVEKVLFSAFYGCSNLTIYAEATGKPSGWNSAWNNSNRPVVWGHTHKYVEYDCVCGAFDSATCWGNIFTFKGYSFNVKNSMAVGYEIDYDAKAKYEEKTGKSLKLGVVFAVYDLLDGRNPLDSEGNAIILGEGRVANRDLSNQTYSYYDFIITGISSDEFKNYSLVISAYINNGIETKYIQKNGLCDTVTGISYNEAKENSVK